MKRYNSYKDSGVEWIGKIPSSWVKTKLKYKLQEIVTGGTPDTSNDSFWSDQDNGINWISISDITSNGRVITETKKFISEKGLESKNLQILPIGSLIYSIYGSIGKISRLGIPSTIHQGILSLKTNSNYNTTFLEYYLTYFKEYVSLFSSSNTQENLNQEKVSNFDIPVPPLSEQQKIVSFLDNKTTLIDSLIEKTQQKIELLKEKRTSLINEVVTKGLNPNVEMKESGLEWIGKIPVHWDIKKMSWISSLITQGGNPNYNIGTESDEFRVLKTKSLYDNVIYYDDSDKISIETFEGESRSILEKGDLLISIVGHGSIGKVNVFNPNDERNYIYSRSLGCVKFYDYVDSYFIKYIFHSSRGKEIIDLGIKGSTGQEVVQTTYLKDLRIQLPPFKEQQQIVNYLDEQTGIIDKTISLEEKRIELLKEYRQSLISEVVTGKRKVV